MCTVQKNGVEETVECRCLFSWDLINIWVRRKCPLPVSEPGCQSGMRTYLPSGARKFHWEEAKGMPVVNKTDDIH